MKRSWAQIPLAIVMACITLVAALFVASQASGALLGRGLFEDSPRPSEADLLDGRAADAERLAAIAAMSHQARGLRFEGVTPVAEVIWTSCSYDSSGLNNEIYMFRCKANVVSYQAWSGEYRQTATLIGRTIASECRLAPSLSDYSEPTERRPTSVMDFGCDNNTSVLLKFGTTHSLTSADSSFAMGAGAGSSRWVAGSSPTDVIEGLSGYEWFAVVTSRRTYYEAAP